jgi:putative N6-adenine-specific DNA methylase
MPEFFASTPKGLVEVLEKELLDLNLKVLERTAGGVFFETNWEGAYKANLHSRVASRILKPVLDFTAYQPEELYSQIQRHDFTKYIKPHQTIAIDATVKECKMHDQRFVAMKVKDAIVDQFRAKAGVRPDVDNVQADLRIHVRAMKNHFMVALDLSGDSLFKRGYRRDVGEAPLKENLAAGLLMLTEWDRKTPLVDFMCGSGTFLIEGAMMALNIAPGLERTRFGFQNWLNYEEDVWQKLVEEAMDKELSDLDFKLYGYDIDRKIITVAKENAKRAGVDHVIEFKREPVATVEPPAPNGVAVVNPPYGARIGDEDNLRDVYRDLGFTLKHRFKGWDCWILSGNKDLIIDLKLKSTRKHFVFNGNIECRWLKYSMF